MGRGGGARMGDWGRCDGGGGMTDRAGPNSTLMLLRAFRAFTAWNREAASPRCVHRTRLAMPLREGKAC